MNVFARVNTESERRAFCFWIKLTFLKQLMEKQVLNPSRSLEIHIKSDNKNQLFKDSNIMKREDIFKSVLSWEIDRPVFPCDAAGTWRRRRRSPYAFLAFHFQAGFHATCCLADERGLPPLTPAQGQDTGVDVHLSSWTFHQPLTWEHSKSL